MKGCLKVLAVLAVLFAVAVCVLWPKVNANIGSVIGNWKAENASGEAFMAEAAKTEAAWRPPTPQPDAHWFPDNLDGWKLEIGVPFTEVPELNLRRNGYGATYRRGAARIEAKAILVTELERDALFARVSAKAKLEEDARKDPNEHHFIEIRKGSSEWKKPTWVEFESGEGERLFCRSFGPWFFYLQSHDGPDLKPFSSAWLRAIDGHEAGARP
ncbi:MAG TPA: hypothetical protein VGO11_24055 [Chthoniobacteraceae bacterium]|jgi:hypothetical protein|nr:hypothetical protein [Chthoniobacteraceae bacterium]